MFLIILEVYLILFSDPYFPHVIRETVINLGVGDIYTYNGLYYRIQIMGNAILPISFLISLFSIKNIGLKLIITISLFLGTFIAGNFAFIISIIFFLCMYLLLVHRSKIPALLSGIKKHIVQKRITSFVYILMTVLLFSTVAYFTTEYMKEVFDRKTEYSLPARFDQISLLYEDLKETPTTFLFGKGFGNTIEKQTEYRDYSGSIYFELQWMYVLNQVGILYFLLFTITTILFIRYFWRLNLILLLYLSYLIYGFTNPYIFDSTNVIVIIVLGSLSKMLKEEGYSI